MPKLDKPRPIRIEASTLAKESKETSGRKKGREKRPEANLTDFASLLTTEQIIKVESRGDQFGPDRRIMLFVLTRSRQQLVEWAREEDLQEVYLEVIERTIRYKENLETLRDFANAAIARMILVGEAVEGKAA